MQHIDEEDFGGGRGGGAAASIINTGTKNVRWGGRTWQTGWCVWNQWSGNKLRENVFR